MSESKDTSTTREHRVSTLLIRGDLDGFGVTVVGERCLAHLTDAATRMHDVVIDLSGVILIDSAGVRLVEHLLAASTPGHPVRLGDASQIVRRALEIVASLSMSTRPSAS